MPRSPAETEQRIILSLIRPQIVLKLTVLRPRRATPDGFSWPDVLHPEQQLVVPLMYTEVVVGLLVTVRPDRAWLNEERQHIETVAESLAAGCVLERHNHWLQHQLSQKRSLQSRQSEIFHNLLHQFRNPLTAVSTFGQLLVRRLATEDPNQAVATGIVRESKRLRELVSHFDQAVAIGDADLTVEGATPALLPAAQRLLAPRDQCLPGSRRAQCQGRALMSRMNGGGERETTGRRRD